MVYLGNRRFLQKEHSLRQHCPDFPESSVEFHPPPERVSNTDIKWNSVTYVRAKNQAQAANVAKATGSKGCHCFMLMPGFDRTTQAFPDMMHVLKNVIVEFYSLFIGSSDSIKLRNVENSLGRFGEACVVDVPENNATDDQRILEITSTKSKGQVLYCILAITHS